MKSAALYKRNLLEISHFFLAILICSININGANFFHTKEIFFFLFLISAMKFGSYKNLTSLFIMLFIYFFTLIANFSNPYLDLSQGLNYIFGLLYLVLLVFANEKYQRVIIISYVISALIVAVMIISIWSICSSSPVLKNALLLYFGSLDTGEDAFLFMIRNRKIFSWWILGVYYGTAPCMIPALAYSLYCFYKNNSRKYCFCALIFTTALVLTMARANILAALAINFFYLCIKQLKKKQKTSFFFLVCIAFVSLLVIVSLFLGDKTESSLSVKTLHKRSYINEFDSSLLNFVLMGWGAGSRFYSLGYKEWTFITELSLYETIRRYGLISTCVIFLCIWLASLIRFCCQKKAFAEKFFWFGAFVSYLFVACTNPFLLGSIGFCSLFFMTTILKYRSE